MANGPAAGRSERATIREVEDVPAVEEEAVDARAEREEAHRDLDDEDDLHGGVEDVEEAPVALPQRGRGLNTNEDGVRDDDRERRVLEPAAGRDSAAEEEHVSIETG